MFWVSIILFLILFIGFSATYIIDINALITMKSVNRDTTEIKKLSEKYINSLGIEIDREIKYHYVEFKANRKAHNSEDMLVLGTFYVWNGKYHINISKDLPKSMLEEIVRHETRHLVVEYLYAEKVIDLIKYTEEIAQEDNMYYNNLFNSGVYLLKNANQGLED